jgi:ABC transporter substrate binding protein
MAVGRARSAGIQAGHRLSQCRLARNVGSYVAGFKQGLAQTGFVVSGAVQDIPELAVAASGMGLRLQVVPASTEADIEAVFKKLVREKAEALVVLSDGFLILQRRQITALAARHSVPAIHPWREFAVAGGLASYGSSIREAYRQFGIYVGQILKGSKAPRVLRWSLLRPYMMRGGIRARLWRVLFCLLSCKDRPRSLLHRP